MKLAAWFIHSALAEQRLKSVSIRQHIHTIPRGSAASLRVSCNDRNNFPRPSKVYSFEQDRGNRTTTTKCGLAWSGAGAESLPLLHFWRTLKSMSLRALLGIQIN
eukprot:TRINITY_DN67112_c0_g1_i2.p1 TRINITY_DN67112_c0_g1~~TRINITY_DN67112_c0_g1_i2.p1  ORF type:complete len:105 (-),score=7.63 TRINITY_DN67112_c0_g1_i2:80-394(-)